jgi:hypothetical protein
LFNPLFLSPFLDLSMVLLFISESKANVGNKILPSCFAAKNMYYLSILHRRAMHNTSIQRNFILLESVYVIYQKQRI